MNFFDWLNQAFEDGSPKQTEQPYTEVDSNSERKVPTIVIPKTKLKLYTAEDVQRDLAVRVLLFLADIQQEIERKDVPAKLQKDSTLLSEFGFSNARNTFITNSVKREIAAHNEVYADKKSALAFIEEVWQKFGKDAMVVSYGHFFEILEKYDMVCGSFDRYTGTIPDEAMDVLANLKAIWEKGEFSQKFGMAHSYAKIFSFKDKSCSITHLRNRARMPFRVGDKKVMQAMERLSFIPDLGVTEGLSLGNISDALFIAAPSADMKPLPIKISFPVAEKVGEDAVNTARRISSESVRYDFQRETLRLSAIRKEEERLQAIIEKSDIPRYCKCDFIKTEPMPERKVFDPFICSLTHHGVLIFAKWGAEAEDETIKRYEQLRDAVIGKGGAK